MVVCGYTSIDAFFRLWVCLFACLTLNVIGNTLWKTIKYLKVIIFLYDLFFPQKHSPPILHCLHILLFSCHVFFFFNLIFLLYNTVLVLPYIDMNPPQVYMSSQPWTPLPLPSSYHLSGSSQCTSPKHPVSYIEPRLAIRFLHDSIHVSVPFSQIIPPSPSPTEYKRLFFTSMSLLLSRIQGYHYHLSKFHIYVLVYCVGVFLSGLIHSV